jgi:tRNA-specific 2-thiouridylase
MLAGLDPRQLARVDFPLGEQDKEATRAEAERAGLAAARKPESQEACFLAGDDYRAFLGRHGLEPREGAIVGEDGSDLGRHDGFWRFTPGQRRGLGLSAGEPLYVLGTQPSTNAVVVGPRESLARTEVTARGRLYADADRVEAKLRYRSPAVGARVESTAGGFRLVLDEPAYGVAAGQAAVLYDGDTVVGYGLITASH